MVINVMTANMPVCSLGLGLISLCAMLGARIFYLHPKSADVSGILNENLFIVVAIFLVYVTAKGIFSHKAQHYKTTLLDTGIERLVMPVLILVLFSRYTTVTSQNVLAEPELWILVVLLSDPWRVFGRCLQSLDTIQTGHFLRPLLTDKPLGHGDYLMAYFLVVASYIALWW